MIFVATMRAKIKSTIPFGLGKTAVGTLMAFLMAIYPAMAANADQYDDQIAALQTQAAQYQAQAGQLKAEADNLQSQIDGITAQESALQTKIAASELKLQQLNDQIEQTQAKITSTKQAIGQNLKSVYIDSSISPLEMVASSKSISDFIDKQEYRNKIRDAVQEKLNEVKTLNAQLAKQRSDVEHELAQQKSDKDNLAAQEVEKNDLLAQTQGQQQAYQQLAEQQKAQIATVRAAQAAAFARVFGNGYRSSGSYGSLQYKNLTANVSCGGGYPSYYCAAGQDAFADEWDLYNRECVSYAAWAMQYRFGKPVPRFRGHGNAEDWPGYLNGYNGIAVNETPAPHTVVVIPSAMIGGVGHAAIVESIDGDWLHISQYNWNSVPDGRYSEMDLKIVSGLIFIHFP